MSWQVGDEGEVVGKFTDRKTKEPIDWASTTAVISITKPGASEPQVLDDDTSVDGEVTALVDFDTVGVWRGHITLTGEYRRKVGFRVEVFDE